MTYEDLWCTCCLSLTFEELIHAKPAHSKLLRGNLCTTEQEGTISAKGFRSQFLTLVHSCGVRGTALRKTWKNINKTNTKPMHWCDRCAARLQTSFNTSATLRLLRLQCCTTLRAACFHSCQEQVGIVLQLSRAVLQRRALAVVTPTPNLQCRPYNLKLEWKSQTSGNPTWRRASQRPTKFQQHFEMWNNYGIEIYESTTAIIYSSSSTFHTPYNACPAHGSRALFGLPYTSINGSNQLLILVARGGTDASWCIHPTAAKMNVYSIH